MSIRITVFTLIVLFLAGYAWKSWFNALMGAIMLFAFLEHPDMPRSIAGIPGLNLWNILFLSIGLAWLSQRIGEGTEWDSPGGVKIALLLYLAVLVLAFLRAFIDPSPFYEGTRLTMALDFFVNPLKFLFPALMLYDGCRTRKRVIQALVPILLVYFFLALLSIKSMGFQFGLSSGDELSARAARRLVKDVGYHRVDLSMMLGGACWAVIAFSFYFKRWWIKLMLFGAAAVILMGQAVTGGRTGYATWGLIGLTLCVVKWRKLLPLLPLGVAAVVIFVPAVRERMFQGFAQQSGGFVSQTDSSSITSGRTRIWPYVIEKIGESPAIGYGRNAMQRTGLATWLLDNLGEEFGHPHNAYLEFLLDNGFLGFLCGMPIFAMLLSRSFGLFRDRDDLLFEVTGGVALALLLSLLIAGLGAQTLYSREGVVPMWAALAVALRVWVQRENALNGGPVFPEDVLSDTDREEAWSSADENWQSERVPHQG
jgi:O-antigen ligase